MKRLIYETNRIIKRYPRGVGKKWWCDKCDASIVEICHKCHHCGHRCLDKVKRNKK